MHSFRTPSLSTKESGVIYCNQCDNIVRRTGVYKVIITATNSHSTSSGRIDVHFILWIVKVSYSHLCPGYQVFAQVMNAIPQGGEEGGGSPSSPLEALSLIHYGVIVTPYIKESTGER